MDDTDFGWRFYVIHKIFCHISLVDEHSILWTKFKAYIHVSFFSTRFIFVSSIYLEKFLNYFLPNTSQKLLLFSRTQITLHEHFYCVQTFQESLFASQPTIYNPDNLFATLIVSHKYCHSKRVCEYFIYFHLFVITTY